MQTSEDPRVQRTRQLMEQALIDLTTEKGFANVTVRDIAERAGVNRSTFYRHYLDKYDLLGQYIQEMYARLEAGQSELPQGQPAEEPAASIVEILKQVQQNTGFFRALLSDQGDTQFCARSFRQFVEQQINRRRNDNFRPARSQTPPLDMSLSYLVYAGMGAVLWWLENGQSSTPEQVASWLSQLSNVGLNLSKE